MNISDFPIDRINKFLKDHIFVVETFPHSDLHPQKTNVKVKLTGVNDYYSVGDKMPHIEYTMYILPTNESSDIINSLWGSMYGSEVNRTSHGNEYYQYIHPMSRLLMNFLQYFGVDKNVICTRIINEVKSDKLNRFLPT